MMRRVFAATAFLAALPFAALAADLPSRKGPPVYVPPPPVFTWTGFYIGGDAGYSWGRSSVSEIPTGAWLTTGTPLADLAAISNLGTVTPRRGSFTGSGVAGFNYQVGMFVFGIEGDLGYLNTKTTVANAGALPVAGTALLTSTSAGAGSLFGTVRGRVGVAIDHVLLYGTGGLAVANTSLSQSLFFAAGTTAFGSISTTRVGWAAGAGVEWAFTNNWTLKLEYLHSDLGKTSVGLINATLPAFTHTTSVRFTDDLVRVGINYKFDWFAPPASVVAKY